MGLKERQQIARIQQEEMPGFDERLQERMGTQLHFEVDWESFEDDIDALYRLNGFLLNVWNGVEFVTRDDIGKQAVGEQIQRIVVKLVGTPAEKKIAIEDGAFILQVALGADHYYTGSFSDSDVQQHLEDNL